jgi:hypothetical protein
MIIKLWDNEDYEYPLVEIKDDYFENFKHDLDNYRDTNDGTYNSDDFFHILKSKKYFIRLIIHDKKVFF